MLTQLVVGLPLLGVLALFHAQINSLLFHCYASPSILMALLLSSLCETYSIFAHTVLTLEQRARTATLLQVIFHLSTFMLTYLFVVHAGKGAGGIIYAQLCGNALACVSKSWYAYQPGLWPRFPTEYMTTIRENFRLGVVFSVKSISTTLTQSIDRWILLFFTSLHTTGLYSLAAQGAMMGHECILMPFIQVYTPYLYHQYRNHPEQITQIEQKHQSLTMIGIAVCCSGIVIGYVIGAPIAQQLLPDRFHAALPLCVPTALEKVFLAGSQLLLVCAYFHKRIIAPTALILASHLLNAALDIFVVRAYGAFGCAYVSLATAMLTFGASAWYAQRLRKKIVIPVTKTDIPQAHIQPPQRPYTSSHV